MNIEREKEKRDKERREQVRLKESRNTIAHATNNTTISAIAAAATTINIQHLSFKRPKYCPGKFVPLTKLTYQSCPQYDIHAAGAQWHRAAAARRMSQTFTF